ncbi:hypothetical protein ACFV5N_00080 [Streptomyces sp. NPDC059853]
MQHLAIGIHHPLFDRWSVRMLLSNLSALRRPGPVGLRPII